MKELLIMTSDGVEIPYKDKFSIVQCTASAVHILKLERYRED